VKLYFGFGHTVPRRVVLWFPGREILDWDLGVLVVGGFEGPWARLGWEWDRAAARWEEGGAGW